MPLVVDSRSFDAVRARVASLGDVDPDPLLEELGTVLAAQTRRRLETDKASPSGTPWPARAEAAPHPLLEASRRLVSTIIHEVVPSGVDVGSPLPYAVPMLFGSSRRNIRARPFLGIGEDDGQTLEQVAVEFLAEAI